MDFKLSGQDQDPDLILEEDIQDLMLNYDLDQQAAERVLELIDRCGINEEEALELQRGGL